MESVGEKIAPKLWVEAEILRLQRRAEALPLSSFVEMTARNTALVEAHAAGSYSMKEIAQAFDVRDVSVCRAVD